MNRCILRRFRFIYFASLCCAVAIPRPLLADFAVNMASQAHMDKPAPIAKKPDEPLPSGLDFSAVSGGGFLEMRRDLIASVYESSDGLSTSKETTGALIQLATFYLAHGLVAEGQSIIENLDRATLSEEQTARLEGISIALNVLDPSGLAVSKADITFLEGQKDWPGQALFRSLYFIKKGEPETAAQYLANTTKDVLAVPEVIQEMILPKLLEAAIDLGKWEEARKFAELITQISTLNEGSAYHYLLGRTAEHGQDYLVAFEHYVKASGTLDRWSQLARLSLVKIGLKTHTLTPQDARGMLEQIHYAWHGDALAAETMDLLVTTELFLDDIPAALELLGGIIYINDDTDAVEKAKQQSNLLLEKYYSDGVAGKTSLTEFLPGHKSIAPDYRFQEGFDVFSEKFANMLLDIGASNEAANEYETTFNYMSVAQDLGLFDVPEQRLDQLRLKQVAALLRGGQYDSAEPILALGAKSDDADIQNAFQMQRVNFFNLTGNAQSVLKTSAPEPSINYLRIKADAYFSLEDWENATKTYCTLWERQGNDLIFMDASNLLLSAYRSNNRALVLKLAKAFPDLTSLLQWQQIAASLAKKHNATNILQKDVVTKGISDAAHVLDVLDTINTSSQ